MQNSFLSSQQKMDFCILISDFRKQYNASPTKEVIQKEIITVKSNIAFETSTTLGLMTSIMVISMTIFALTANKNSLIFVNIPIPMLLLTFAGAFISLLSLLLSIMIRKSRVHKIDDQKPGFREISHFYESNNKIKS